MSAKPVTGMPAHAASATDWGADLPDSALVVAAQQGSAWAKEALFRRHFRFVHGFAFRLLGSDHDLSDVVQDSMKNALESLHSVRDPGLFSSWLGRVVINTARRSLRRRRLLKRLGLVAIGEDQLDQLVSPDAPPDVAIEIKTMYRVVDRLSEKPRIALLLRHVEALSMPQIADQMEASLSSVKRWLAQAQDELARELKKETRRSA